MIQDNLLGFYESGKGDRFTQGVDPATGKLLFGKFKNAISSEVDEALKRSAEAFEIYRKKSANEKAKFLYTIADQIEEIGETLIERCCAESGLASARITGERGRTTSQLRMFADLIEDGSWVEATIERADADRSPIPKPDIRRILTPMGPVVIFAASNFPLAFSTAGGDTASALAGGNTVIVKAHSAHPGTSALVGEAINKAAIKCNMPDGVFSLLHGSGKDVGQRLIKDKRVKAAGFTGSEKAGRILYDLANQREEPIPFFAEMGSVNPVLVLPSALNSDTAEMLSSSITLGSGQFCTNPGLILSIAGNALEDFIGELSQRLSRIDPQVMLTEKICKSYNDMKSLSSANQHLKNETESIDTAQKNYATPVLLSIEGKDFLNNLNLSNEVFGPYSIIVKCKDKDQLNEILANLKGQLTGTVFGTSQDFEDFTQLIDQLEKRVGRLIFNGVPTGVEVCSSMQHGGPYPASSDSRFTSVGTMAIKRFVRPIAFQSWPDEQLPHELQDSNPLNIWRLIDGKWTKD